MSLREAPRARGSRRMEMEHHTVDELVWMRHGRAVISAAGRVLIATTDTAVYLPAGHDHGVHLAPGAGVEPVFLPCVHRLGPDVHRLRRTPSLDAAVEAVLRPDGMATFPGALQLLIQELVTCDRSEAPPWPQDPRAVAVARALRADPADPSTLAQHARRLGVSERTLQRAFTADTGLPFSRWRAAQRLAEGVRRLRAGEPVAQAARASGYTPSAFIARYRARYGTTPGRDADARSERRRPVTRRRPGHREVTGPAEGEHAASGTAAAAGIRR